MRFDVLYLVPRSELLIDQFLWWGLNPGMISQMTLRRVQKKHGLETNSEHICLNILRLTM